MKLFQLQETEYIEHEGSNEQGWKTVDRFDALDEAKEAWRTRPTNWTSLRLHVDLDEVECLRVEAVRLRGDLEWAVAPTGSATQEPK